MRATALFVETAFAVSLITSLPFAKRRTGDSASAANQPEIFSLFGSVSNFMML